jgi:DNA-binding IclR family transcriptional regulator
VTSMLSTAHASGYGAPPEGHPDRSPADSGRSSVDKALEILEILVDHPRGEATLSELAARVGLPKSTVHRLVTELCQHGLAGRVGVKYCPGLKLAELSVRTQWSEHRELLTIATPVLEWLFERADGTTVHLGVLRGLDVVYLEKLSGAGGSRIPSRVGARLPASCTGIGKALLAASGYADILAQSRVPAPLRALTPYSVRDPRILANPLRQIQDTGISHDNGEAHIGVHCIAAAVIVRDRPIAAVSMSVYGTATKLDRFAPWLHDAANRIARDLAAGRTP